jgi:hypothetical protein
MQIVHLCLLYFITFPANFLTKFSFYICTTNLKGMQARNIEMAKSLLRKGLDINLIQEVTSLSKKFIEELAKG